jgi:Protein of unknown function (DUF2934)
MAASPSSALIRRSVRKATSKPDPEPTIPSGPEPVRGMSSPVEADEPAVAPAVIATEVGYESHHEAISRAAYFLAEARGFAPGHELDDWLTAEGQLGLR